ncbi:MAG: CCA tRNA nucleotidyltransferase [Thermoplasmata archaeon]|nr:CCA tRNA nucleotidyltransferase [Thermoplasmata archaeon]
MDIEKEVLARLKPSPEDEAFIHDTVDKLIKTVMSSEAASKCEFEPYLVGSIAKNTHLKDPDADLFLLFHPDVSREDLEKHGLAIGKESIIGREHYAEHPYIKGTFEGLKTDIVPAYKILDSSQKMTAVDRTPFHTEFVKENLDSELQDDVRLLKAFMKGIGTYSAEAKVLGFSGYLCELLIIKYDGFQKLLAETHTWKKGMRLEIGPVTDKKFDAPLTFIDPVDPGRNVASAVSTDSLATFIAAANDYLSSPDLKYFFPNPIKELSHDAILEKLEHRGSVMAITLPKPDIIDDILYPQLRKFEKNTCQMLSASYFMTVKSASYVIGEEMAIIIELQNDSLPISALHRGPPVWVRENAQSFLAKWKENENALSSPFVKDGHWHVFVRRKHTSAMSLLSSGLSSLDMGKDLNKLKDSVQIYDIIPDIEVLNKAFSEYLDKRLSWNR